MKYDELYDDFKALFPEDASYFAAQEDKTGADKDDGMHVLFGMIVSPFLISLAEKEPEKAQKAFEYIEQMQTSGDDNIANVAEVSVLEVVMTDKKGGMAKLGKYLGTESLKAVEHLSRYFKIQK